MAIAEASVRIVPDLSGFAQQTERGINSVLEEINASVKKMTDTIEDRFKETGEKSEKAVEGIADQFKKLGKLVAGAAVGRAVFNFAKQSIAAASDLGESINAVQVTFGELSDQILDFSETSATAVGLAASDFNSFAVRFAGFTKQIATGNQNAADVTKELTTRIADFASVMNLDLNEAATVFASTLAGESEAIRRFGIDMSAASIEAFALESGLIASKSEMTAAIKVQATYAKLMRDTAQVAGDFANTSDSLANRQRILAAEFKNLQVEVGTALIPILESVLSLVGPLIQGFIALPDGLQKTITFAVLAGGAFLALSSALQGVGMAAKTANIAVGSFLGVLAVAGVLYLAWANKGKEAEERQKELNQALIDAEDPTATLVPQMEMLVDEYNRLNPAAEEATEAIESLGGATDFVRSQTLDYLSQLNRVGVNVEDLTKSLQGGTDSFEEMQRAIGSAIPAEFAGDSTATASNLRQITNAINNTLDVSDPLRAKLIALAKGGEMTAREFQLMLVSLDDTADAFDDQREEVNKNAEALIRSEDGARAFAGVLGEEVFAALVDNANATADAAGRSDEWTYLLEQLKVELAAVGYEIDPTTGAIKQMEGALDDTAGALDAQIAAMQQYVTEQGFIVNESGRVEASQQNVARALELAQERFDNAVEAVEDYKEAIEEAFDAARSSIDTGFALVESQKEAAAAVVEYEKAVRNGSLSSAEFDALARDTASTLLEVADNAVANAEAIAAMKGETLGAAEAQAIYRENLLSFMETLDPTSPLFQYLNGFLQTLDGVPTDIPIELTTEVETAQRELSGFEKMAEDLGFQIGTEITQGILQALAPLSPEFGKLLREMQFLEGQAKRIAELTRLTPQNPKTLADLSPFLSFADGGIFNQPQVGLFAEAGPEAIIPLSRPGRALELMRDSGLLGLAQSASSSQNFDIKVMSAEPMQTARDVVREFQALQYRMGPV